MAYGIYDTWYDKVWEQYSKGESLIFVECESCGKDVELDLDCLGLEQLYDVPDGDGETVRICKCCFDSWVDSPGFKKEFKKICAVSNDDILKELKKV